MGRFVNDADYTQRHPHLADLDSRRAVFQVGDFADRIGLGGDLTQTLSHSLDALGGQFQTIQQRRLQSGSAARVQIALIGGQQGGFGGGQRFGDGQQGGVFDPRFGAANDSGRGARALAHSGHVAVDSAGSFVMRVH